MENNRAKQFMPFDALKGLREALKEKEKIIVEKRKPTTEELNQLNNIIMNLKKGEIIAITHYKDRNYIKTTGIISKIDLIYKEITIVKEKIPFIDIIEIEKM